jgi:hypothetical protein
VVVLTVYESITLLMAVASWIYMNNVQAMAVGSCQLSVLSVCNSSRSINEASYSRTSGSKSKYTENSAISPRFHGLDVIHIQEEQPGRCEHTGPDPSRSR